MRIRSLGSIAHLLERDVWVLIFSTPTHHSKGNTMSPTSSIINGFASMTFPALLAVILLVGLLMFASAMFVMHIQATQSRAHVKHARRRFQNNSEKEDFFDMVTRFRDEIPA